MSQFCISAESRLDSNWLASKMDGDPNWLATNLGAGRDTSNGPHLGSPPSTASRFVTVCYPVFALKLNFGCYSVSRKQNIETAYNYKKEF